MGLREEWDRGRHSCPIAMDISKRILYAVFSLFYFFTLTFVLELVVSIISKAEE